MTEKLHFSEGSEPIVIPRMTSMAGDHLRVGGRVLLVEKKEINDKKP